MQPGKSRCSKARAAAEVKECGLGRALEGLCVLEHRMQTENLKRFSDFSYKSKYVSKLLREGPANKELFTKKYL